MGTWRICSTAIRRAHPITRISTAPPIPTRACSTCWAGVIRQASGCSSDRGQFCRLSGLKRRFIPGAIVRNRNAAIEIVLTGLLSINFGIVFFDRNALNFLMPVHPTRSGPEHTQVGILAARCRCIAGRVRCGACFGPNRLAQGIAGDRDAGVLPVLFHLGCGRFVCHAARRSACSRAWQRAASCRSASQ